jgi:hypothetical protein
MYLSVVTKSGSSLNVLFFPYTIYYTDKILESQTDKYRQNYFRGHEMPAVSQQQQKLMALALAYKRGEAKDVSAKVKEIAGSMSEKDLEDFASTKHKGLPMKKEELIKEGLSVLKEQTFSRDMFGVTGEPDPFKQTPSGGPRRGGLGRPTAAQKADLAQRQSMKRLQTAALDDTRTLPAYGDAFFGTTSMKNTKLRNSDNYSRSEMDVIRKYYENAITNIKDNPLTNREYNRKYGNIDTGEYGTLRPAIASSQAERLAKTNLPSPSEDSVLGSFADRFIASGGRSRDAGSGSSKRVARGAIVTPKSSGRGTPATAPPATAPTATTTSTTTAASQNFLKNIDPKLAAGIAAGTLGAAGLAAFVANRRRKKKRG